MTRKLAGICMAVGLLFPLLMPTGVAANSHCNPNRTGDGIYRYVAWTHSNMVDTFTGIGATIEVLDPYVSFASHSAATITLGGGNDNFIQIGVRRRVNISGWYRDTYYEVHSDGGHLGPVTITSQPAIDTTIDFQLALLPTGKLRAWQNGQIVYTSQNAVAWDPTYVQVASETASQADQLMGGKWDYEDYTNVRYTLNWAPTYSSFGYVDPQSASFRTNTAPSLYGYTYTNGYTGGPGLGPYATFGTWDWACF